MDIHSLRHTTGLAGRCRGPDHWLLDVQAAEADRLVAAELAGDYTNMNDALADALLEVIRDHDASIDLRGTSAIALGGSLEHAYTMGFEDDDDILLTEDSFHQVLHTLQQLYLDSDIPEALRRKVLEASVRAPQDWHDKAVRTALAGDDLWRRTAIFCMRFISGFDDAIVEALDDDHPRIQYHAVCAAGDEIMRPGLILHCGPDVEKNCD